MVADLVVDVDEGVVDGQLEVDDVFVCAGIGLCFSPIDDGVCGGEVVVRECDAQFLYAVEGEDVGGGGIPPESDLHLELAGAVVAFCLAVVVGGSWVGTPFAAAGCR